MCRNIKPLFNFEPPVTGNEIHDAALQFVRKISGFNSPSRANEQAFNRAVEEITRAATDLLDSLQTNTPPRDRQDYEAKAKARAAQRYER